MPQVSVIIPVHNGEARLRETLGSVVRQTLVDLEIILINDASTDSTADILEEFRASDDRIRIASGPGIGSASAARNVGLALATGDYLAFLDADDFFAPTLLEKLHTKAIADNADIVVTKFRTVDQATGEVSLADWAVRLLDLPATSPFSFEEMGDHRFLAFNPTAWNKLFRTSFIRQADLRFQTLKRADDLYFTYMALALAKRICVVEGYLIDYYAGNPASLEGSLHESPLDFVSALELLKESLRERGMFEQCERAFVNVAAEVCLSNLNKVKTASAFVQIHRALLESVYESVGIAGRAPEYFLRSYLAEQVAATLTSSPEELLFARMQQARDAAARAQAEARVAVSEIDVRANAARLSAVLSIPAPKPLGEASVRERAPGPVPDVSVIIPVHNTAAYLEGCISSVLTQTGVSLEVVCVDDGSTDLSGDVLDQLAATDSRIKVIHQENAGPSMARNRGIEVAGGRYVCFVDSDDWWQEDSLAKLVARADADRLDLMLFDATAVREPGITDSTWAAFRNHYERSAFPGVYSGAEMMAALHGKKQYLVHPCLYLVRRDYLCAAGLSFYPGIVHEDNLFTFGLMLGAARVAHSQRRLYCRRLRPGSIMTAGSRLASAQGYLISYLEMVRTTGRTQYPEPLAAAIAAIIFSNLKGAHDGLAQLSVANLDRLREIDPTPEAQTVVLMLLHWRYLNRPRGAAIPAVPPAVDAVKGAKPPVGPIEPGGWPAKTVRARIPGMLPRRLLTGIRSALKDRLAAAQSGPLAARLARLTAASDRPVVLLLDGRNPSHLSGWVAAFGAERLTVLAEHAPVSHDGVRCVVVAGRRGVDEQLMLLGSCAIVVDEVAADPVKQLARWARFGLHVEQGGWYVVGATVRPEVWQSRVASVRDDVDVRTQEFMTESAAHVRETFGHLLLPKLRPHLLRVNDSRAEILSTRSPELRITTVASRPPALVTSRTRVFSHGSEHVFIPQAPFEAPPLTCRWYRGELEVRAQLLTTSGATALPPSFRHAWATQPGNHRLQSTGRAFAQLPAPGPTAPLDGDYFDLNAAVPGHFGHVMTESIGRLWAWDEARAAIPGIKGLYRLPEGAERPTFEGQLFEAFGLAPGDVTWATSDLALQSYVSATMPWHNGMPHHYHPEVKRVWERLRSALVTTGRETPERIFVSRGLSDRGCRNQSEVENWFTGRGFAVVYPERLSLGDQATLFANARVVAGFAGSALFNVLFSEGLERLVVLTHEQYVARNEWLFGACLAEELHYFWSAPDTVAGPGVGKAEAFDSTWAFDFDRFSEELEDAIAP